jgi:hypothetical protein
MMIETMTWQKAEGYWGDNNPKPTMWVICLKDLAGSKLESSGAPKGLTTIKSRWHKVSLGAHPCMHISNNLQLKQEYDIIKELQNLSGLSWDDAKKCVTASHTVWADYCKVHDSYICRCSSPSHMFPSLRLTPKPSPSARKGSLSLMRLAASSTAPMPLVSSHFEQAKPWGL